MSMDPALYPMINHLIVICLAIGSLVFGYCLGFLEGRNMTIRYLKARLEEEMRRRGKD